jgi:hypothetical protein
MMDWGGEKALVCRELLVWCKFSVKDYVPCQKNHPFGAIGVAGSAFYRALSGMLGSA